MPMTAEFEYNRPRTWKEALEIKSKHGFKARVLAGGTDLIVLLKEKHISADIVIDIKKIPEISDIKINKGKINIGANVTFSQLIKSDKIKKYFPLLWEAAMTVASVGVRNRASMVGNICSAVPCADSAGPLLVYKAEINLLSEKQSRKVPIDKWFTGPKKTAINPDEIVHSIEMDIPKMKTASAYLKLSRYDGEDLAQGSVSILMDENKNYFVSFGSLAPTARLALKTIQYLKGKKINEETIKNACSKFESEISPISDIRSTKEYRTHMAKVMLKRGLEKTISRFYYSKPAYGEGMIE